GQVLCAVVGGAAEQEQRDAHLVCQQACQHHQQRRRLGVICHQQDVAQGTPKLERLPDDSEQIDHLPRLISDVRGTLHHQRVFDQADGPPLLTQIRVPCFVSTCQQRLSSP